MSKVTIPTEQDELFKFIRTHLFVSVIGDVMDVMGLVNQFLPADIRPLLPDVKMVGRAVPVLEEDLVDMKEGPNGQFGRMFQALDSVGPDGIYVCTGSAGDYALWGELMATRASKLGGAGAVLDGFHRDTAGLLKMRFPVFSKGSYGQDQGVRGHVVDFNVPIEFANGTTVKPGDILFGDIDGVICVPREIEREVVEKAYEKATQENHVATSIKNGMSACEAYETYGIL